MSARSVVFTVLGLGVLAAGAGAYFYFKNNGLPTGVPALGDAEAADADVGATTNETAETVEDAFAGEHEDYLGDEALVDETIDESLGEMVEGATGEEEFVDVFEEESGFTPGPAPAEADEEPAEESAATTQTPAP